MKYLKTFEANTRYKVGDYIILIHPDNVDISKGYKKNDIFIIDGINNKEQYININDSEDYFRITQIRKATPTEIEMHKYNI